MINDLCKAAHAAAVSKGFYENGRELPELLMLIVSELSEALEADRHDNWCKEDVEFMAMPENFNAYLFKDTVKDTVQDEIADAFIRLFDLCGHYGIDIESHINAKMLYNATRPHKHGKEY